ncbi:hypothetical protein E6O75_ATG06858 [Venturia nashicola]|uniref:Uncharacterized protein n=1 Tax=Venturia nashicola TaxID=86259 RepID=A0A4Z1NTU3_9PEZI|nr:hypothetical protein E6O75_ATG06858 [Venturia nashicola]
MNPLIFSLLFLSFLAAFAAAEPAVNIHSYCPYPIYFSHDVTRGEPQMHGLIKVLHQGDSHRFITPLDKTVALKFSREWQHKWGYNPGTMLQAWIPLTQFEYNWESNHLGQGHYIQYNWSNVDCRPPKVCPFIEHGMVAERPGCPSKECKPGDHDCKQCYQKWDDDHANVGCYLEQLPPADIELNLCNYMAPHAKVRRSRIWSGQEKVVGGFDQPANSTEFN